MQGGNHENRSECNNSSGKSHESCQQNGEQTTDGGDAQEQPTEETDDTSEENIVKREIDDCLNK